MVAAFSRQRIMHSIFFTRSALGAAASRLPCCKSMTTISHQTPNSSPDFLPSAPPLRSLRLGGEFSNEAEFTAETPRTLSRRRELLPGIFDLLKRRWKRERRRRKVGRAYDMALEIARFIPGGAEILDVGCGNGFIAHHLSAMFGVTAMGIDLGNSAEAPIDYRRYDGEHFPAPDSSFDAVLLCYVLHHAQEVSVVLDEVRRVLREGGLAVIYEDMPARLWDKGVCWIHNQQWRGRTGPCTFRSDDQWHALFCSMGFELVNARSLSRWRNLAHPVSRRFYLLRLRMDGESRADS
jgi:SAM-dependent methyltransferase